MDSQENALEMGKQEELKAEETAQEQVAEASEVMETAEDAETLQAENEQERVSGLMWGDYPVKDEYKRQKYKNKSRAAENHMIIRAV